MTPTKCPLPSQPINDQPLTPVLMSFVLFFLFALVLPLACGHRRISGRRLSPPQKTFVWREATTGKMSVCAG